jgi:hypothetical protein
MATNFTIIDLKLAIFGLLMTLILKLKKNKKLLFSWIMKCMSVYNTGVIWYFEPHGSKITTITDNKNGFKWPHIYFTFYYLSWAKFGLLMTLILK